MFKFFVVIVVTERGGHARPSLWLYPSDLRISFVILWDVV